MNCKGCPYEGKIRYHFIEGNVVFGDLSKANKDVFDKATKENTQCTYNERRRIDGKMICIQSCGPEILTSGDVAAMGLKSFSVKTEAEARAYIQADIDNWEVITNPVPEK